MRTLRSPAPRIKPTTTRSSTRIAACPAPTMQTGSPGSVSLRAATPTTNLGQHRVALRRWTLTSTMPRLGSAANVRQSRPPMPSGLGVRAVTRLTSVFQHRATRRCWMRIARPLFRARAEIRPVPSLAADKIALLATGQMLTAPSNASLCRGAGRNHAPSPASRALHCVRRARPRTKTKWRAANRVRATSGTTSTASFFVTSRPRPRAYPPPLGSRPPGRKRHRRTQSPPRISSQR